MLIDAVRKAIHGRYTIKRKGTALLLAKGTKVHTDGDKSFGFSLDSAYHPPFPFFRDNPPKHLTKMCDAIIMFERQGTSYCAVIEQKTGDLADYEKQLANGKFFCEWLVALCKEHGYIQQEPVKFYGVLIWEPRLTPLKGSTAHDIPQATDHRLFDKFFDIQNESDVHIGQLAS